jgi:hypothetical protein
MYQRHHRVLKVHDAATVNPGIAGNGAVDDGECGALKVHDTATVNPSIAGNSAVVDGECGCCARVLDSATSESRTTAGNGAVVDGECTRVRDTATGTEHAPSIAGNGAVHDGERAGVVDTATRESRIVGRPSQSGGYAASCS